ncbi:hypothetical protein OEZ85_006727 [Tetradesmus obliquus]|uniref:Uncharacterized protein n=1 Tax=Tetradesmus obliquus TaxID=3088 RepID=A0ABY8TVH3_TETOB|nr:hypothetical protein OEZ85_006727 [Tetradesmus obliquus]
MPGKLALQQAGQEQESSTGRPRQTLQRRVQNALRWRSWGGESDTAAPALATRPPSGPGRHRAGRSAGSDVELSALPSTTTSSICSDMPVLSSPAATVGSGEQLARSTIGSTKSSTSSAAGAGLANDAGSRGAGPSPSSAAGIQQQQQQCTPAIGITGATDDACSIVTQAGSTAHSFTSLYSMLADQGEAGSETAGPSAAATAGIAGSSSGHTGGAMSPFRGSDAGGDVGTSVSTLPLISEMAYDDEQQLMQERPDNDETCSYATQAGSVHSVSSVLSSAFAESAPQQRTSGSGSAAAAGQQQLLIHPLSEPTDELGCFEEEDASLTAAARSSSAGDGSIDGHHLGLSSPGSSSGQQQAALGAHAGQHLGVDNAWGLDEQQWQQQQAQGGPAAAAAAGAHGAAEAVCAW